MTNNLLTDARGALAVILKDADLRAFSAYPGEDSVSYPLVYVTTSEPYLTFDGAGAGCAIAHYDVIAISTDGASPDELKELDVLILAILDAVDATSPDWQVDQVDQPGEIVIAGTTHLAVRIGCQHEINRR